MNKPAAVPMRSQQHRLRIVPGHFTAERVTALLAGQRRLPVAQLRQRRVQQAGFVRAMPWLFALLLVPGVVHAGGYPAKPHTEPASLALTTLPEDCTQHRRRAFFASSDGVLPLCWDIDRAGMRVRIWYGDVLVISAPAAAFINDTPASAGQGAWK